MSGATANANASIREWEPRRDRPLCFHWKAVDIDWIKSLDLPLPRNFKHAEARASVLLEALITNLVAPEQWVSYSRRKEWWSNGTRYRGTSYSYATVLPAVDELAAMACSNTTGSRLAISVGNLGSVWAAAHLSSPRGGARMARFADNEPRATDRTGLGIDIPRDRPLDYRTPF